jgi:hypothetical protein
MSHEELTAQYSYLTRDVDRSKSLGDLLAVVARVNSFKKQLPTEYLWMIDRLNEQANQKKVRLIAFNDYIYFKAHKAHKKAD